MDQKTESMASNHGIQIIKCPLCQSIEFRILDYDLGLTNLEFRQDQEESRIWLFQRQSKVFES
jgi:hypothetical protein